MRRARERRRHSAPGRRRNSSGLAVSLSCRMYDMKNMALSMVGFRISGSMHCAQERGRQGPPGRRRNSSGLVVSPSRRM